jgi:hypothetical protein
MATKKSVVDTIIETSDWKLTPVQQEQLQHVHQIAKNLITEASKPNTDLQTLSCLFDGACENLTLHEQKMLVQFLIGYIQFDYNIAAAQLLLPTILMGRKPPMETKQ